MPKITDRKTAPTVKALSLDLVKAHQNLHDRRMDLLQAERIMAQARTNFTIAEAIAARAGRSLWLATNRPEPVVKTAPVWKPDERMANADETPPSPVARDRTLTPAHVIATPPKRPKTKQAR